MMQVYIAVIVAVDQACGIADGVARKMENEVHGGGGKGFHAWPRKSHAEVDRSLFSFNLSSKKSASR